MQDPKGYLERFSNEILDKMVIGEWEYSSTLTAIRFLSDLASVYDVIPECKVRKPGTLGAEPIYPCLTKSSPEYFRQNRLDHLQFH